MSCENLDELCTQALELVLLDEFIEVGGQQLEDETQMVTMDKRVSETQYVVLVVGITRFV